MRAPAFLIALLLSALPAKAAVSPRGLPDALAARSLLGADTWCRIVRIENTAPRGLLHTHDYPKVVYAAVFELSGILWFYTATEGTQSLSLTTGTAQRDELNPGQLFTALYPGFTRWTWVDQPDARSVAVPAVPANGCFVQSVSFLHDRLASGGEANSPRLLSFYVDTAAGRLGHTVLVYGTSRGLAAMDPGVSFRQIDIPREVGESPLALSAYVRGAPVTAARTLPLRCGRGRQELLAEASFPGTPEG